MRPPLILLEWGWRRCRAEKFLDFHHLEIFLARAALRAGPVHRHVFPARAGLDAFVGQAGCLVVDEAADEAHPRLVLNLAFAHERAGRMGREFNPCRPHLRPQVRRPFSPLPPPTPPAAPACSPISSPLRASAAIPFRPSPPLPCRP